MNTVDELLLVLALTVVGGCVGFVVFILKHEKEHEKGLREANNNKNSIGQHDKSCDDVMASGGRKTTRTTGKTTTSTTSASSV